MEPFTCPRCGTTSHHPMDAFEGYCGACHDWTDPLRTYGLGPMHYDIDGKAIPPSRYSELRFNRMATGYHRIAEDRIGMYRISTVWLGMNHNFGVGPPLIFETMVFLHGTNMDTSCYRYPTKEEALAGHEAVCAEIRVLEQQDQDQPAE